jgi:hypothetical protein
LPCSDIELSKSKIPSVNRVKRISRAKAIILASVAAIVLCAAVLTIFVLTPIDDRHYGRIVTWASKHFAGLQVTMEGPFLVALSSEPFITASKIRIRDISNESFKDPDLGSQLYIATD